MDVRNETAKDYHAGGDCRERPATWDSGVWSPILLLKKESVSSILACPTSGIAAPAPRVTMEEYKEGRGRVNVILFLALG